MVSVQSLIGFADKKYRPRKTRPNFLQSAMRPDVHSILIAAEARQSPRQAETLLLRALRLHASLLPGK
jgi:hypothetical protein